MSTVTEIEAAIEKLPAQEFRVLRDWIVNRAEPAEGRVWSPEELGAAAEEMVAEPDPVKAKVMWNEIVDGFYGRTRVPDDHSKTGPPDGTRINIHEDYELRDWANHFGVTKERIKEAVGKVGVVTKDVKTYLGSSSA